MKCKAVIREPIRNAIKTWLGFMLIFFGASECQGSDWSIGTINQSYHFEEQLNETHEGLCIQYKKIGYCEFINSLKRDSKFLAAYFPLQIRSEVDYDLFVGAASGYKDQTYAIGDNIIMFGGRATYKFIYGALTPIGLVAGLNYSF